MNLIYGLHGWITFDVIIINYGLLCHMCALPGLGCRGEAGKPLGVLDSSPMGSTTTTTKKNMQLSVSKVSKMINVCCSSIYEQSHLLPIH